MKIEYVAALISAVLLAGCASAPNRKPFPSQAEPAAIKSIMQKTADWQLANPSQHHTAAWHYAAFYTGLTALAQMADTYYQALLDFAERNNWQPHSRIYHADDHCVGQMYIALFRKYHTQKMIAGIRERFNYIMANPSPVTLEYGKHMHNGQRMDRWWWCDALFMAPPVWAKLSAETGDHRYLNFMNSEWWATTDYLYDEEEQLYYRDDRFFEQCEANGRKVFWSRGNGWVFAGLARVLEEMPADYPDRPRYEKLFRDMAAKLLAVQPIDGMWRASLLDPESYPNKEASGTGFFTYGLAWGINNGYLDKKTYLPGVIQAWQGLVACVHPDGKLGYVQPVGYDPRQVGPDQTEVYGVGAFLLAGSELYKIVTSLSL